MGSLLCSLVSFFASAGLAFYSSWKLTLVIMSVVPVTFLVLSIIARFLGPAIENQKAALTQASKKAHAALTFIDTVKAYLGQEQELRQYSTVIDRASAFYLVQARTVGFQMGFMAFVAFSMYVQGFWYGSTLIDHGLSSGTIFTCFYACFEGVQALESCLPQWIVVAKGIFAGATLKSLMAEMHQSENGAKKTTSKTPPECRGDIEGKNVSSHHLLLSKCCSVVLTYLTTSFRSHTRRTQVNQP